MVRPNVDIHQISTARGFRKLNLAPADSRASALRTPGMRRTLSRALLMNAFFCSLTVPPTACGAAAAARDRLIYMSCA